VGAGVNVTALTGVVSVSITALSRIGLILEIPFNTKMSVM
jgi:hypothetical protein